MRKTGRNSLYGKELEEAAQEEAKPKEKPRGWKLWHIYSLAKPTAEFPACLTNSEPQVLPSG